MKVWIVGAGPGAEGQLLRDAYQAIEDADLLIGAQRLLDIFEKLNKPSIPAITAQEIAEILANQMAEKVAIIVSGDIGFFSAAKRLCSVLHQYTPQLICGISSLQYFAARLQMPWEDIKIVSLHGRPGSPVSAVRSNAKTFFLTGGNQRVQALCRTLCMAGLGDLQVSVGEYLSYPEEKITKATAQKLMEKQFESLAVMLVENPHPMAQQFCAGLSDELFIRGEVPMTKSEVRAVILSKISPQADEVLYDVGAGTGSVAIEMALCAPSSTVYAIERKSAGIALIEQNREKFGVQNLTAVLGCAPDALEPLPAPDRVFIGGSAGELEEILQLVLQKNPTAKIVISAITLETIAKAMHCLKELPLCDVEIVQISVARDKKAGGYHMMMGQNPVTIITAKGMV